MREIRETIRARTIVRVLKPETVRLEKTGEQREVRIYGIDGTPRTELRDIEREVHVPAVTRTDTIEESVWIVSDGTDDHEFTDRSRAEHFARVLDGEEG